MTSKKTNFDIAIYPLAIYWFTTQMTTKSSLMEEQETASRRWFMYLFLLSLSLSVFEEPKLVIDIHTRLLVDGSSRLSKTAKLSLAITVDENYAHFFLSNPFKHLKETSQTNRIPTRVYYTTDYQHSIEAFLNLTNCFTDAYVLPLTGCPRDTGNYDLTGNE